MARPRNAPPKTWRNAYVGVYRLYHTYKKKSDAKAARDSLFQQGYLANIRENRFGYSVYRRQA
jgi:hypothetical protein